MKRDTNAVNNGAGWLDHTSATLETDHTAIREDLINRIILAATRQCPQIVPARRAKNIHSGAICSLFGMPFGFRNEDYVTVTVGYVYRSNDGTTYGTVYQSAALAEAAHNARAEASANDFRSKLNAMTAAELNDQAAYWLKS